MREEFLTTRSGKTFVLYQGLLDEAHKEGLHSINTELVQVPTAENGNVAIAKATVEMEQDSTYRTFTGWGDASPENVKNHKQLRLIAMAETRAKARALRDAVNVGVAALEELSDGEEGSTRPAGSQERSQGQEKAQWGRRRDGSEEQNVRDLPPTRKQLNYLHAFVEDMEGGVAKFEEMAGKPISELTRQEASEWIGKLSGRAG